LTKPRASLVLHGGAGGFTPRDYTRELAHMRGLIEAGRDLLAAGASALDVVVETVAAMEASGLYLAGRGAFANTSGHFELDASVMDGKGRRAGAVAALQGFASPIRAARAVLETPQVLLVGEGAADFAEAQGLERVDDSWFTPILPSGRQPRSTGTVGCAALDLSGVLAAATSTGGVRGKPHGRVGDSPIPGAGVWADENVAVSCTGAGEYFIRTAAAAQLAFRVQLAGETATEAANGVLAEIAGLGGAGGIIALGADGRVVTAFNTPGMQRAALHRDGRIEAAVF
jgi:L-asparaginase/beta-aspartyl-peptidase (threonine type)